MSQELEQLTLFAVDSHVKTSPLHGTDLGLPVSGQGSGLNTPGLSEKFSQDSSSSKTSQTSENVGLPSSLMTLPAWGTMRITGLSQRQPWAHRISASDCGLPHGGNGNLLCSVMNVLMRTQEKNPSAVIAGEILKSVIASGRLQQMTTDGNVSKRIGALLPTPTVQDGENNCGPYQYSRNTYPLNVIAGINMNPRWVEWLMGFPDGHTEYRSLETQ